jgi:uncharacterized protein (TIGR02231 family)
MKRIVMTTLLAVTLTIITVNAQEKIITAGINNVTVFSQGAQLSETASVPLQPGTIDLVAGGLSPYIDPNSIQVTGEGDFMILGVNHRNNYLENPVESARVDEIRKKIDALTIKIDDEKTAIEVLHEKESFLKANYNITSGKTTFTPEQMKAFLDLFSTNTETIKTNILKKSRVIKEYEKEKQDLENQLQASSAKSKLPTGQIIITATATKAVSAKLKISYVVMNAGWYPSYDIRIDDIGSPASIIYKANIYQSSGIDWNDVKISLSSSSPMTSGALPVLYPWFIDFYAPMYRSLEGKAAGIRADKPRSKNEEVQAETAYDMVSESESAPLPVVINESTTSFSFDVNINQTILSDGKPEIVELQRLTVPASFKYESVPKVSASAFLMGYITGWEKYNLLSGEANIYFSNTFTGTGSINTAELTDTLPVSLGADKGITIKREKRVDYSSHKMIGANVVETRSFLISVRNNKKQNAEIKLHDQLPVSQNSDITVEATELSGGKQNQQTGEVKWDLIVAPQETKTLILTYTVKFPKNQKVILE